MTLSRAQVRALEWLDRDGPWSATWPCVWPVQLRPATYGVLVREGHILRVPGSGAGEWLVMITDAGREALRAVYAARRKRAQRRGEIW
jgi:hypothetical protein